MESTDYLKDLIEAINRQTAAISRLAESNMALVSIVLDEGDEGSETIAEHILARYMDGTPIRVGG
ncbi:hypothetical protein ACP6JA_14850 [Stutzerimonas frequens]